MLRRLYQTLCVIAALSLSGAHHGIGQAVAWADMLLDHAANTGQLADAVKNTFDGSHPCKRCLKVQEESGKDQQEPQHKSLKDSHPITGALCVCQPLRIRPDLTLLGTLRDVTPTVCAGFHDVALRPPERV